MSTVDRDVLRAQLRCERAKLDEGIIKAHSTAICDNAMTLLGDARHVAGYYAFGAEVDLSLLMATLGRQEKHTYVPIVLPEFRMQFARVDEATPITLNRYGIKEPQVDESTCRDASQLDAVLVPLVGFDEGCNRMGMGGGYYDRNFAHRHNTQGPPLLIGVAYEMQCVNSVHAQSWDVPLDYVVTETRILKRSSLNGTD